MNQRIKELAEQCGFRSNPNIYDRNQSFDIQKFADLIVRECISMADKESERYSDLDQEYCSMAMDNYRELVRQYFGVEE